VISSLETWRLPEKGCLPHKQDDPSPREPTMRAAARVRAPFRRGWLPMAVFAMLGLSVTADALLRIAPSASLHYAPNRNFGPRGDYLPDQAGFNLADVSTLAQLDSLPAGVKGLVWVGQCDGATAQFLATVRPYIGNRKLFGFYLMDHPDPRSRAVTGYPSIPCTTQNLNAESDWIHANAPGAKTFMLLMNLSSSATPWFDPSYNPAMLHVDLFGLDPYPCRSEFGGCDYNMIDRYLIAAEARGVPRSRIIPIYQAFGEGEWVDDGGGTYLLPTAEQEQQMLSRWGTLVGTPVFDYAYSWGRQKQDRSLESAADLRAVFAFHNGARFSSPMPPKITAP
jgi:hypothetical protein